MRGFGRRVKRRSMWPPTCCTSPSTRRTCFALNLAALRAIASTAARTTSASYGRSPHGVNTGVYPAMTLTWESPVRRWKRLPNSFWSQLRFSATGSPPLNERLVILKLLLKHRIGDDQSHRRIYTLALVLALHGPDVLVLVHLDGQVRQCPFEQRVVVVVDPFGRQISPEQLHRRRQRL